MTTSDLHQAELNQYFERYISKITDTIHLREGFEIGKNNVINFFSAISNDKLDYRYTPEKWSIKEVLQHLIDTERIFMYRCFRIARNDKTDLASFDQNIYMESSNARSKSIENLLLEFKTFRESSINLLNSLTDDDLKCIGLSSGEAMSARAAAFMILGHDIWHMDVIKEKYL